MSKEKFDDYKDKFPEDSDILGKLDSYEKKEISKQDIEKVLNDLSRLLDISKNKLKRFKRIMPLYIYENKPKDKEYQDWLKKEKLV